MQILRLHSSAIGSAAKKGGTPKPRFFKSHSCQILTATNSFFTNRSLATGNTVGDHYGVFQKALALNLRMKAGSVFSRTIINSGTQCQHHSSTTRVLALMAFQPDLPDLQPVGGNARPLFKRDLNAKLKSPVLNYFHLFLR